MVLSTYHCHCPLLYLRKQELPLKVELLSVILGLSMGHWGVLRKPPEAIWMGQLKSQTFPFERLKANPYFTGSYREEDAGWGPQDDEELSAEKIQFLETFPKWKQQREMVIAELYELAHDADTAYQAQPMEATAIGANANLKWGRWHRI